MGFFSKITGGELCCPACKKKLDMNRIQINNFRNYIKWHVCEHCDANIICDDYGNLKVVKPK